MRRKVINRQCLVVIIVALVLLSGCGTSGQQWIYQANSGGVMKFDVSGKEYYHVSNITSKEVVADKGWLYYVSDDGKINKTKMNAKEEIQFDPVLFTYHSKKENKEYTLFDRPIQNEITSTDEIIVYGEESDNIAVSNGVIYFSNKSDHGRLYKVNTDGTGLLMLTEDTVENISVDGQWVYYSNIGDLNSIFRVKNDGTEKRQITDDYASWIQASGNWVYYKLVEASEIKLYKIKVDGSNRTQIVTDKITNPHVFGEWIYFNNGEGFFKIKVDGSNRQKLS